MALGEPCELHPSSNGRWRPKTNTRTLDTLGTHVRLCGSYYSLLAYHVLTTDYTRTLHTLSEQNVATRGLSRPPHLTHMNLTQSQPHCISTRSDPNPDPDPTTSQPHPIRSLPNPDPIPIPIPSRSRSRSHTIPLPPDPIRQMPLSQLRVTPPQPSPCYHSCAMTQKLLSSCCGP